MASRTFTPEEIQDLTDRVYLLKEQLEKGKMHFAPHLLDEFLASYKAIRIGPDGLVDPHSVDGRIRASTLAIKAMRYREDAKKQISLLEIQEEYFKFLFQEFGPIYKDMARAGATPSVAARVFARDQTMVKRLIENLPDLSSGLHDFWYSVADPGAFHLQDGLQLKATFAGDLFPAHWENAVSTAGLYIDTIVLPCPISRIAPLVDVAPPEMVAALLIKHVLTAMSYRDIATADVSPPIALVLPNSEDFDEAEQGALIERATPAIRKHGEYLFGRAFESIDHLAEFCTSLSSVDQVLKEARGADRLIFDTDWGNDPRTQLLKAIADQPPLPPGLDNSNAGHVVLSSCLGRLPQAQGAQANALHFGGTPLINAHTSWLYYSWLLEYEAKTPHQSHQDLQSMHIARALSLEGKCNLEWLGNVPPETVLEIRKKGLAEEVRALLGHGVHDLIKTDPSNYFRTADQVVTNLSDAFERHLKAIQEAKTKKLKLYGIDVASCVAVGGISVAAAITGSATLGAASGLLGIAGLPTLKDIKSRFAAIKEADKARRASPTGLLFRHIKK